jgi:uncharacterized membrane protein YgcG
MYMSLQIGTSIVRKPLPKTEAAPSQMNRVHYELQRILLLPTTTRFVLETAVHNTNEEGHTAGFSFTLLRTSGTSTRQRVGGVVAGSAFGGGGGSSGGDAFGGRLVQPLLIAV